MIRRPPRSTQSRSSAASDVYKRQVSEVSIENGSAILARPPEENFAHERTQNGIDAERPVVISQVAGRDLRAAVSTPRDKLPLCDRPVLPDSVQLKLGQAEHHPKHEPPGRRRGIKVTGGVQHNAASGFDFGEGLQSAYQCSRETIEPGDNQARRNALSDSFDSLV